MHAGTARGAKAFLLSSAVVQTLDVGSGGTEQSLHGIRAIVLCVAEFLVPFFCVRVSQSSVCIDYLLVSARIYFLAENKVRGLELCVMWSVEQSCTSRSAS